MKARSDSYTKPTIDWCPWSYSSSSADFGWFFVRFRVPAKFEVRVLVQSVLYEGLLANSLVMMSDGSYNEKIGRNLCSCAAVIYCRQTQQKATVTWVEKSDVYTADNYRAELLGGIALQLLVQVATDGKYISSEMRPRFGSDNKGVVHHGNHPRHPMPALQTRNTDTDSHMNWYRYSYRKKSLTDIPAKFRYEIQYELPSDLISEWFFATITVHIGLISENLPLN
jgi:hypothetical protein